MSAAIGGKLDRKRKRGGAERPTAGAPLRGSPGQAGSPSGSNGWPSARTVCQGAATAARCAPNRQGHQGAQEGRRGVFLRVCRVRQGEALKTRLRRFLELPTTAETVLRMHVRRDTPPPRRPMAVEREKGACSAYHPSPRPSRQREGSESPSVVRGAAGGALRFLVCSLPVSVGPLLPRQGAVSSPFGLRAAPTP